MSRSTGSSDHHGDHGNGVPHRARDASPDVAQSARYTLWIGMAIGIAISVGFTVSVVSRLIVGDHDAARWRCQFVFFGLSLQAFIIAWWLRSRGNSSSRLWTVAAYSAFAVYVLWGLFSAYLFSAL